MPISRRAPLDGQMSWQSAFMLHLWSFFLPLLTLTYLLTGPHPIWVSLLWAMPVWVLIYVDVKSRDDKRAPPAHAPAWPFDLQLYLLTVLQLTNHIMLGVMTSKLSIWPAANLGQTLATVWATIWLPGVTAGYSGIVLAHEWVHRRKKHQYFLGRLLLMFVWYEHFATEHVRGHHPRLGTPRDPATARFGESFRDFLKRTVPAQFKSAYHLECVRLGDPNLSLWSLRSLKNRVVQGVLAQIAITAGYVVFFGPLAAIFLLLQARSACVLLEVVNYIEHWGIERDGKTVTHVDSWDTGSWFTLHTLVGLSRHADHHAQASRPYQKLRYFEETPKMPSGYYGTIILALMRNDHYQELATAELKRRQRGPFRLQAAATAAE